MTSSFVHLHNHSECSLLNGAIRISDLVKKTKEMGMSSVSITDYGNLFGALDFYLEAKKAGIKPILGCVVFHPSNDDHKLRVHRRGIDHLFQLVLLIENEIGYKNICKLLTQSYLEGFYYKPRVDSAMLKEHAEGLIALSCGWDGAINQYLLEGQIEKSKAALAGYRDIFGDRFYVELQDNGVEGQQDTNRQLLQMARDVGAQVVATNNCHYLNQDDAEAFEALLCIQSGATLHGAGQHLKYSTDGYYFKTPEEMSLAFEWCPEAIENTSIIADKINFKFDLDHYHFPVFIPPDGLSLDEFLKIEARDGLKQRWSQITTSRQKEIPDAQSQEALLKIYETRLERELDMIIQMGFSGYFLIVSDFIRYAKGQDIPVGPGRGSAAGSLVAYCTQITDLDPIPYHLLFERFLNPERVSMPDVDIDFCMHGRAAVLEYVTKKYGNVSQIITFGKMKAKAVIRDVGRVLDIPYADVDRIAKLVPNALNITLELALEQEPRLQELVDNSPHIGRLMQIAKKLEGMSRHASTHAAGVVISDKPLSDFVPLYKGGNDDVVTQFDMKAIEKVGLIKFDFLGLKTLTVIDGALKTLKRTKGISLHILDILLDDPDVYALLSKGDTAGVFQLESSGMKDLLIRMKPSTFEDLVALVALYRPGPLGSGMVDDFINRKQGKTPILYDLPELKTILEDTYGVIVYQEQVMQISSLLAGYSLGEADILRRAMGKKKAEEMASQRVRFLQGCADKKFQKEKAEKIFDLMAKFAEYGFNKSHSAAYALVSYQTAYLKAHHMVEYLTAVLNTEMNDTDRILYYKQDADAHGIKMLPPDINESAYAFSVVDEKSLRYGLGALKGAGENAIIAIIETRNRIGRFKSFFHFCASVDHKKLNKRVIESLIKSGAFDGIEKQRASLLAAVESCVDAAVKHQRAELTGQTSLFNLISASSDEPVGMKLADTPQWFENETLAFEKESLGFYFSGHPLKSYEAAIKSVASTDSKLSQQLQRELDVTLAGTVAAVRVITTKKGSRMAFVTLEDLKGSVEVIVFSDEYLQCADLLGQDKPLIVKGKTDRTEEGVKIIATEITLLGDYLALKARSIHLKIPMSLFTEARIETLYRILNDSQGQCRGYIHLIEPGSSETVLELPHGIAIDGSESFIHRVNLLFQGKVVEYSF